MDTEKFDFENEKKKAKKKYCKLDDNELMEKKAHLGNLIFNTVEGTNKDRREVMISSVDYVALDELLIERSMERRSNKVFSKLQTEIITASTAILAFCALAMLLVEGIRGS
jgi:hypothetical protein